MTSTFPSLLARAGAEPLSTKTLVGLYLVATERGSPVYDPLALIAVLRALKSDGTVRAPTSTAEAQAWLDDASCTDIGSVDASVLVVTDVSLRSTGGVSDTDDRLMLLVLCVALAKSAPQLRSVTVVLSARKKASDATTPEDVAGWMRARLVELGVVATGVSPTELLVGATQVVVFQQHSQRTASAATKLDVDALDDGAMLAELAEANGALLAHLAQQARVYLVGCGPMDVLLAKTAASFQGCSVGYGGGINAGDDMPLAAQHSNRGATLLFARYSIVDIGPEITRGTTPPAWILAHDDAGGLRAVSDNSFKVAGTPLMSKPGMGPDAVRAFELAFRIFVSNCTSLRASPTSSTEDSRYCEHFALSFVANGMLAYGSPIDRATLADGVGVTALAMPKGLAACVAKNVQGIETVEGLYTYLKNGIAARLRVVSDAVSAVRAFVPGTSLEVTSAVPVVHEAWPGHYGLVLAQPFA
jgi:hypothetical protein